MDDVRMPAVAGAFYPDDGNELRQMAGEYLGRASPAAPKGRLRGIIVPHAGYIYSGPVAAYGYKLLATQNPERIIILGPSHHAYFQGLAESGHGRWSTPLGEVETFSVGNQVNTYPAAHGPEHSLEVQLPFLQLALAGKKFKVDPILTGEIAPAEGAGILEAAARDAFLVVSSDLSHYLPYDVAVEKDSRTIALMEKLDLPGFLENGDACGKTGIAIAMALAKKKGWKIRKLHYANSGDTAGPRSEVVGYAAMAIVEGK